MGLRFVRFLAACYLVFSLDHANVTKALEAIPPIALQRAATGEFSFLFEMGLVDEAGKSIDAVFRTDCKHLICSVCYLQKRL